MNAGMQSAMHQLCLSLVLPLLMLLSQQGAAWHEIEHLREVPSPVERQHKHAGDPLCKTCLAFAHLAVAAKPEIATPELLQVSHARVAAAAVAFVAPHAPAERSRGPPHSL
ncbi:MAG TPA: hypothetical protein VE029_06655 [Rhizobacter sp.]|nr:hypothetical protein [Rhizobacter sp.]